MSAQPAPPRDHDDTSVRQAAAWGKHIATVLQELRTSPIPQRLTNIYVKVKCRLHDDYQLIDQMLHRLHTSMLKQSSIATAFRKETWTLSAKPTKLIERLMAFGEKFDLDLRQEPGDAWNSTDSEHDTTEGLATEGEHDEASLSQTAQKNTQSTQTETGEERGSSEASDPDMKKVVVRYNGADEIHVLASNPVKVTIIPQGNCSTGPRAKVCIEL